MSQFLAIAWRLQRPRARGPLAGEFCQGNKLTPFQLHLLLLRCVRIWKLCPSWKKKIYFQVEQGHQQPESWHMPRVSGFPCWCRMDHSLRDVWLSCSASRHTWRGKFGPGGLDLQEKQGISDLCQDTLLLQRSTNLPLPRDRTCRGTPEPPLLG